MFLINEIEFSLESRSRFIQLINEVITSKPDEFPAMIYVNFGGKRYGTGIKIDSVFSANASYKDLETIQESFLQSTTP
jgi:hypothetical protein